jgi:hypothetical protein
VAKRVNRSAVKIAENFQDTWGDILRRAVGADGRTEFAICQEAGIEQSMLARFMAGASINVTTAERIGRVLGIDLTGPDQRRS